MRIIIDSNILIPDPRMSGPRWRILLENLERLGHKLCVPRIVVDEVVAFVSRQVRQDCEKVHGALTRLGQLAGAKLRVPGLEKVRANAESDYQRWLEKTVRNVGMILELPDTPHQRLIQRAISRRRPFNEEGSGYRDALIWDGVLDLAASEGPDIVFISNNTKDFAGQDGRLHPHLQEDMRLRKISVDRVRYYSDLEKFYQAIVEPELQQVEEAKERLQDGTFPGFSLTTWIDECFYDAVAGKEWNAESVGLRREFENPSVVSVQDVGSIDVQDVRRLPSGELVIEFEANLDCEFDFYIFKGDLYCLPDDERPSVQDWNDHYYRGTSTVLVNAKVILVYNPATSTIETAEVEDIWSEHGTDDV